MSYSESDLPPRIWDGIDFTNFPTKVKIKIKKRPNMSHTIKSIPDRTRIPPTTLKCFYFTTKNESQKKNPPPEMEASGFMASKWIATAFAIWIQCSCGAATFSIYSSALKSSQGYDQSTLGTVSVFKDIGTNAGIISGFLCSAVTSTFPRRPFVGPWMVYAAGAVQCFLGYIFMWAAVSGLIDRPSVPVMCFFMLLASHAQTFFSTANVVTGVHNFKNYSGTIVGIMKVPTQTLSSESFLPLSYYSIP